MSGSRRGDDQMNLDGKSQMGMDEDGMPEGEIDENDEMKASFKQGSEKGSRL